MPVDPSIPLAYQPQDPLSGILANQNALMQLSQMRKQIEARNALAGIMSNPGARQPDGTLKPDAMGEVWKLDPQMAQQMTTAQAKAENQKLHAQVENADLSIKKNTLIHDTVLDPSINAYDEALKDGATPQQASDAAQQIYTEGRKTLAEGGLFSEDEVNRMPGDFDPLRVRSNTLRYKDMQAAKEKADTEARQDKAERERERHDSVMEGLAFGKAAGDGISIPGAPSPSGGKPPDTSALTSDKPLTAGDIEKGGVAGGAATPTQPHMKPHWEVQTAADGTKFRYDVNNSVATTMEGKPYEPPSGTKAKAVVSDDAAKLLAEEWITTGHQPVGFSRNPENVTKIANAFAAEAKAKGLDGAAIASKLADFAGTVSAEKAIGTRTANMEVAANEVKYMAPMALAASKAVSRTNYPDLNKIIIAGEEHTGDPTVVQFGLATNSLIYMYAKFLNPNGIPTDADKAKATEILSRAWSDGQYDAAVSQIQKEIAGGQGALQQTREEMGTRAGGKEPGSTPSTAPASTKKPKEMTDDEIKQSLGIQ